VPAEAWEHLLNTLTHSFFFSSEAIMKFTHIIKHNRSIFSLTVMDSVGSVNTLILNVGGHMEEASWEDE